MNAPRPTPARGDLGYAVELAATTIFWAVWVYLVLPLVSVLLWYLGFQVFYEEMVLRSGYEAFIEELEHYGLVVLAMLIITLAWVNWNVRRYGGPHNTRTRQMSAVMLVESADAAGIEPEVMEELQQRKRIVVSFNEADRLVVVDEAQNSTTAGVQSAP